MAHVLVVDDDRGIRDAVRLLLEDAGHTMSEADNGLAALEILRETPQRLVVLLDLVMPELDGASVLRAVAEDEGLAQRHGFIVFTAADDKRLATLEPALLALPVHIVRKPFSIDEVLDAVTQAAGQPGST